MSMDEATMTTDTDTGNATDRIRSFIERVEVVEMGIRTYQDDRKEIYSEAGGEGFDVKVLKAIVKRRKQDRAELAEHEAVMDVYLRALGEPA